MNNRNVYIQNEKSGSPIKGLFKQKNSVTIFFDPNCLANKHLDRIIDSLQEKYASSWIEAKSDGRVLRLLSLTTKNMDEVALTLGNTYLSYSTFETLGLEKRVYQTLKNWNCSDSDVTFGSSSPGDSSDEAYSESEGASWDDLIDTKKKMQGCFRFWKKSQHQGLPTPASKNRDVQAKKEDHRETKRQRR